MVNNTATAIGILSSSRADLTATKAILYFWIYALVGSAYNTVCTMHTGRVAVAAGAVGHSFYRQVLQTPRFISAPMVDQSSIAWRIFVRMHGVDLAFSQMMHAKNFVNDKSYRADCVDWDNYRVGPTNNMFHKYSNDIDYDGLELKGKQLDSPLIVQLAGDDPFVLVQAGKYLQNTGNVSAIDLNLGCPQKIAKRGNYGAYLLSNKELIVKLLSSMVKELSCPITAKVRVLANDADTIDLCQAIESCGVSMLTVHGREVTASKLFTGPVNWDIIRKIKSKLNIPVVANGGISCYADALRCLEATGADGVMSSEALLENPKLFSEEGDYLFRTDYARFQLQTVREFLEVVRCYPLPRPLHAVIRGHLFKMLHRFLLAEHNKDLQMRLSTGHFEQMCDVVNALDDRIRSVGYSTEEASKRGLLSPTGYYMRHRDERAAARILSLPKTNRTIDKLVNSSALDSHGNILFQRDGNDDADDIEKASANRDVTTRSSTAGSGSTDKVLALKERLLARKLSNAQ